MKNITVPEMISNNIAQNSITLIKSGKVRNHKLRDNSREHTGLVEHQEQCIYRDFLQSKNCCMVIELTGTDIY